ncbi:hypothetical protein FALBO_6855 [Fusarium albosuccineum]|uniref:Uncharacterized protein n=1 Tax=Fusarium albosuccineum TaxID=1237068 RepID=A0A8H4PBD8_9HYPO|nr:hypothetical protein FALBO_6855 [Fusarium albosuccineum]
MRGIAAIESTLTALTSDDFDRIRSETKTRLHEAESAQMEATLTLNKLQGKVEGIKAVQKASGEHIEAQRQNIDQRLGASCRAGSGNGFGDQGNSNPMEKFFEATAMSQMHLVQMHSDAIFQDKAFKTARAAGRRLTALDRMWKVKQGAEQKLAAAQERERIAVLMRQADNDYDKACEEFKDVMTMAGSDDWAAMIEDIQGGNAGAV